jgi:hypothetical protein
MNSVKRRIRTAPVGARLAVVALGTLAVPALLAPGAVEAQEDTVRRGRMICWRGAPPPACGGFFLIEAQGAFPLVSSAETVSFPGGTPVERDAFESRLEWNLGYMVNVSPAWAVGGAVTLGTGSYDALTGVRARARRWLTPQMSVEVESGMLVTHAANLGGARPLRGFTADARLNVGDHGSFFLRWDAVDVPAAPAYGGFVPHSGGLEQALYVGVGTGSTWTVAGTAVLGLWYAFVIAALVTS